MARNDKFECMDMVIDPMKTAREIVQLILEGKLDEARSLIDAQAAEDRLVACEWTRRAMWDDR